MNKKGFISITAGITIAIIVAVGGYLFISNNNNSLSKNQIYNTTYDIYQNDSQQVDFRNTTLVNGEYTEEYFQGKASGDTEPNCTYTLRVSDSENAITHIDYDNDGDKDAFVNLVENFCGGSSNYIHTALLENKNDNPAYIDSITLGDRKVIKNISQTEDNNIKIRFLDHSEHDSIAKPTLLKEIIASINDGSLENTFSNQNTNDELGWSMNTEDELIDTYGEHPYYVFQNNPEIFSTFKEIYPELEDRSFGVSTGVEVVEFYDNRSMIVMPGCFPSSCGNTYKIGVYNPSTKKAYLITDDFSIFGSPDDQIKSFLEWRLGFEDARKESGRVNYTFSDYILSNKNTDNVNNLTTSHSTPTNFFDHLSNDIFSFFNLKKFKDNELGVSFKYPRSWGDTVVENDFSSTEILRKISFSEQPNVYLVSVTEKRLYPAYFDEDGIAHIKDIEAFCDNQKLFAGDVLRKGEEDQFRLNSVYKFGNCSGDNIFINIAKKQVDYSGDRLGWIPIDDTRTPDSQKIKLSKSYFWKLNNPLYTALTLKIDIPDIETDGFCKNFFYYGGDDYRLLKKYSCINHQEKPVIESAFYNFKNSDLSNDVNNITSSLEIYQVPEATSTYRSYFKEKSLYENNKLGLSFVYPKVFGEVEYNEENKVLNFANDNREIFKIRISTFEDAQNNELEGCTGLCSPYRILPEVWETEQNFIEKSSLGEVQCPSGGHNCSIKSINGIKMLVRYYNDWPYSEGVQKEYIFYENNRRFNVIMPFFNHINDPKEYENFEDNFKFNLVEEIVQSIKVK